MSGFIPSVLGLEQMIFEDKDPWLKESLSKDQIARLEADDLGDPSGKGLMPRALDYTRYFRQRLGTKARVCLGGDMFSRAHAEALVYPCLRRALAAFGGGLVHFCGDGRHLLDSLLDIPEVKGVNLGDPQMHAYPTVMGSVRSNGKVYYGSWPRQDREDTRAYFRRLLGPLAGARKGLILIHEMNAEKAEGPERVKDVWRSAQDASRRG